MSDVDLWLGKARRAGARITDLITADAAIWFTQTIRTAFVDSAATDALTDPQVEALKAAADAAAQSLVSEVTAGLEAIDWAGLEIPPAGPQSDLGALPAIAELQALIGAAPARFAGAHPSVSGGPWPTYALPRRFIDGDDLVTLGRALFKAVAHARTLRDAAAAQQVERSSTERAARWDLA